MTKGRAERKGITLPYDNPALAHAPAGTYHRRMLELSPPNLDRIQSRLDRIEREHAVHILLAIESGSRAWGFASPDSDFDVRFIYAHQPDWYLSIETRRDVIELPIEGDLDINGWDIRKALQLLCKPNPVLLEWLASPIVYRQTPWMVARLNALADAAWHRPAALHHYMRLAQGSLAGFIEGRETVILKKYFYALRPALALVWLGANADGRVPMSLAELVNGVRLSGEVLLAIEALLMRKRETRELGEGPRIAILDRFIAQAIADARHMLADHDARHSRALLAEADRLFREIVTAPR